MCDVRGFFGVTGIAKRISWLLIESLTPSPSPEERGIPFGFTK
jgi:hypothetical protein